MKLKNFYLTAIIALVFSASHAQIPNYVPSNGLVGWWPFNGNANDLSGNNNNGTVNGASLTSDRFGSTNSAYSFNGTQSINCGTSSALGLTTQSMLTISFWTKSLSSSYPYISKYQDLVPANCNYFIGSATSNQVNSIRVTGNGQNNRDYQVTANQWNHVVVIFNGFADSVSVYVNGVFVSIDYFIYAAQVSSQAMIFGARPSTTYPLPNGFLDDIGIWNRALTQQEVTALYNSTTNTCPLITSVTLNAQQTQSSVTNAVVGYLPNSTKIISDTTQWHYIALTKSGSTGNFYFDGTLVTSSSFASNPYIWNSLLLGATQGCVSCSPVADFNGLIDEVRVSNVARTASNITSAYSANSPFTADASTIGLFHLDNISANTVTNTIGGTAATFGTPALANGKFGQAMSFDGVDDYVRWSSSIPVNNMTIEFWVKSSDQSATMAMLEYAYNTGIYLQSSTVTNPILWSTGDTTNTITVNPTQLPYVWVNNGSCSDTIFFNSQSATQYDTVTTTVTVYDTVTTTINDTVTTYLSVTDTLIINVTLTGINPPNNSNTLLAYPNPASDHLIIDCGDFAGMAGYTMKISNSLGQIVFNQPITQQLYNIDLSSWGGKGTYILVIQDAAQTVKASKKIVLQ